MKMSSHLLAVAAVCLSLAACGPDKETTIVHDRPEQPVVVEENAPSSSSSTMTPGSVESTCKHGYDNSTHSCY